MIVSVSINFGIKDNLTFGLAIHFPGNCLNCKVNTWLIFKTLIFNTRNNSHVLMLQYDSWSPNCCMTKYKQVALVVLVKVRELTRLCYLRILL